ncbi:VC0807 family protein [Streptomyces syringium]|uniref:VC0807 family protein n=1 Tax=Streptomyces syringium TaxID=76729 RepID=UPI0033B9C5EF
MKPSNARAVTSQAPAWRALAAPFLFDVALPLTVYYVLRSQGTGQWQALMFSGTVPVGRVAVMLAARRHVTGFETFMIGMLAVRVITSLFTGDPRVLLVKDACLSVAAGAWILGSLLTARPFAFQMGQYWSAPAAQHGRDVAWRRSPALRGALTRLTMWWGCGQVLDSVVGVTIAMTCAVEAVPALNRAKGLALLGLAVIVTVLYSRHCARRRGLSLFGTVPLRNRDPRVAPQPWGVSCGSCRDPHTRHARTGHRRKDSPS